MEQGERAEAIIDFCGSVNAMSCGDVTDYTGTHPAACPDETLKEACEYFTVNVESKEWKPTKKEWFKMVPVTTINPCAWVPATPKSLGQCKFNERLMRDYKVLW